MKQAFGSFRMSIHRFPGLAPSKLASLCAISAPDTPPPTTATSLRIFFVSFLWPAIRCRFISHTGHPVRRSRLILRSIQQSTSFQA
jgi:hypothetical protein